MAEIRSRQIVIAGAGIAGLTAAIAFAARGYPVRIFERAREIEAVGAGIQLSPNATRVLDRLGVLSTLRPAAVRPEAVVLRDAASLVELARVPLGEPAERRWKAPYLVVHRADLQSALLARTSREPEILFTTGAPVSDAAVHAQGVTVSVEAPGGLELIAARLLVGADGVWSSVRTLGSDGRGSRFAGQLAWRRTLPAESPDGQALAATGAAGVVTAFLAPHFHLIVYPVRGGGAFNLAAFTPGTEMGETWSGRCEPAILQNAMTGIAAPLGRLAEDGGAWTAWPIHTVEASKPWTAPGGVALIGDAAHAMTPFAAQGAAMAIEDADTLAARVSAMPEDVAAALRDWERERRPRIARVARRGALNRFAWHAAGPAAAARNLFLKLRSGEKLAADLDWLYGWDSPTTMG